MLINCCVIRKGEELKAPRYANTAATRDCNNIPDSNPASCLFKSSINDIILYNRY